MRVQFRTGERELPEHLALAMNGIETFRMTFDEAIAEVNRRQMGEYVGNAQRSLLRQHFDVGRGRGRDH